MSQYSDPLDAANALISEGTERTIRNIRNRKKEQSLQPRGNCHWCRDKVPSPALFCDIDCSDDHNRNKNK